MTTLQPFVREVFLEINGRLKSQNWQRKLNGVFIKELPGERYGRIGLPKVVDPQRRVLEIDTVVGLMSGHI